MEGYKFFSNKKCEYFPCHKTADEDKFNCMFCYCPLYLLGEKCGGNYKILDNEIKDCSNCMIPHGDNGYDFVIGKINEMNKLNNK